MPSLMNNLLLPLVLALLAPVLASPGSARALENRVWGSNFARAISTGLQHDSTPGTHCAKLDSSTILASECLLAPKVTTKLTQGQQSAVRKIGNIIKNHLKPGPKGDISGTVSDMVGSPISKPGGGYWDHVQEMQNTLRGLRRHATTLEGVADPAARAARQQALDSIRMIEDAIKGAGL